MHNKPNTLAQAEIQSIYDKNKTVKPTLVIAKAKSPKSALHQYFEWDDSKAAHEHRLDQARNIIKKVMITVDGAAEKLVHIPIIRVKKGSSREGDYKPLSVVIKNQSEFERALSQALKHFNVLKAAVEMLTRAAETDDQSKLIALAMQGMNTAQIALGKIH